MEFKADTLDDALGAIMGRLLKSGNRILAGKGAALEFTSVLVTFTDPRARFSRTEDRSTLFSCLGEMLWYLSGSDSLDHISHYVPAYRKFIGASPRARRAPGAYGPRLFGGGPRSQVAELVATLKAKQGRSDTRQAVAQVFDRSDLARSKGDVPCTTTIQFLPRRGKLHVVATMRSNDVYRGFPHDVFAFTFIQELVARMLGMEVGTYSHFVGSLHLYDDDMARARDFLAEGWQTTRGMPPMPPGDPGPQLAWLLGAEARIRLGHAMPDPDGVHPYWQDLARILRIIVLLREGEHARGGRNQERDVRQGLRGLHSQSRDGGDRQDCRPGWHTAAARSARREPGRLSVGRDGGERPMSPGDRTRAELLVRRSLLSMQRLSRCPAWPVPLARTPS